MFELVDVTLRLFDHSFPTWFKKDVFDSLRLQDKEKWFQVQPKRLAFFLALFYCNEPFDHFNLSFSVGGHMSCVNVCVW